MQVCTRNKVKCQHIFACDLLCIGILYGTEFEFIHTFEAIAVGNKSTGKMEVTESIEKDVVDFIEKEANPEEDSAEKFYYTILAPKGIRPNSDFTLNLTIHDAKCDFDEAIVVRISIEDEDDETGFKMHRDVTMKPNETEIVTISVGDLSLEHNYKLVVKGISGITLEREASLDLQTQTHTILIQTDKAIYKPNDCIKYRVLVLDCELKAAAINNSELSICFTVSFLFKCCLCVLFSFTS